MKRYCCTLLVAWLIPLAASAQSFTYSDSAFLCPNPPSGGACATSQTTNSWDDLLEGFEDGDGYDVTWTEIGTTANITEGADSASLTSGKAPGQCNKAWKLAAPTDGTATYARWDNGSTIDLDTVAVVISLQFYVEVEPDNNEGWSILSYRISTTPTSGAGAVLLKTAGGVLTVAGTGTGATGIAITGGQWYTLVFTLDTARAVDGSSLKVFANGSLVGSDLYQRSTDDLRYLYIGAPVGLAVNESGTIWFDLVSIKTN